MPQDTTLLEEGPEEFSGLKIVDPVPGDFMFGAETSIFDSVRNRESDWRPAEPTEKCQLLRTVSGVKIGDSNACTNFSSTNDVAAQLDFLISQGQIDPNGVNFLKSNGYIDASGRVNLSPRFCAVMSGTNPQVGNSLPAVWQSLRKDGVVPESAWPMPIFEEGTSLESAWATYYEQVPQELKDLGKKFTQWFDIQYEWFAWIGAAKTMVQAAVAMETAPLHIATAVCAGWNTSNPIQACGNGAAHATTLLNIEVGSAYDVLDHYRPYMKRFASDYSISYAMRAVVSSKVQNAPAQPPFTCDYQVNLAAGAPASILVTAMQQGLQTVKDKNGIPYMKPGVYGPFGPQTMLALGRFQLDHGIADQPQGHDFGPSTRAALTQALKDNAQAANGEPLERPLDPGAHHPN